MQGPLQPPASEALGHQQAFLGMLVASHFRGFLHDQWYSVFFMGYAGPPFLSPAEKSQSCPFWKSLVFPSDDRDLGALDGQEDAMEGST